MDLSYPHLATALLEPLFALESECWNQRHEIEAWFTQQWGRTHPLLYSSVDLRNAGFKLAPIDTNVFPAGFNNLSSSSLPLAASCLQQFVRQYMGADAEILLIAESHTRNLFYLENVAVLVAILQQGGFRVRVGMLRDLDLEPEKMSLPSGAILSIESLRRQGDKVGVTDFFS